MESLTLFYFSGFENVARDQSTGPSVRGPVLDQGLHSGKTLGNRLLLY